MRIAQPVCVCGKMNRNINRKHSPDGKVHLVSDEKRETEALVRLKIY